MENIIGQVTFLYLQAIVRNKPHQRYLCQRCVERKGLCWFPHKPDDCERCQNNAKGLCYNPKYYQGKI